jgi:15-cis-phytoene synthase
MEPHYAQCLESLKSGSFTDYVAILFLPVEIRPHAAAVLAFDLEIETLSLRVSEPIPGEIRLQWWREAISGERDGESMANPLARALLETISLNELPLDGFQRYLDARLFDLYNDPMPDRDMLEGYLGETESFIFQILAMLSGQEVGRVLADACGHAGVAYGIATLLARLPIDIARRRQFIPGDLLASTGQGPNDFFSGWETASAPRNAIVTGMAALAREHDRKARAAIHLLRNTDQAVFLRLAKARPVYSRAAKTGYRAGNNSVGLSPLVTQYHIWKTAIAGF